MAPVVSTEDGKTTRCTCGFIICEGHLHVETNQSYRKDQPSKLT